MANNDSTLLGRDKDAFGFDSSTGWFRKTSAGGLLRGLEYGYGTLTLTDSETETYKFYDNSTDLTLLLTITLIFTDSTKETLASFERTA